MGAGVYTLIKFEDIDNLIGAFLFLIGGLSILWFSFIKKIVKDNRVEQQSNKKSTPP